MLCVRFGQTYSIYSTIDILYMRFNNEEIRTIVGEAFSGAQGYILYHKALSTRQEGFDPQGYLNKKW